MRQLFTWRFVAVIVALAGLAVVVNAVFVDDDPLAAILEPEVVDRQIDFIARVDSMTTSDDFELGPDGVTRGIIDFTLDSGKVMRIAPGTLGDIDCRIGFTSRCVVFAELLGDAVIWFALRPQAERNTVELPEILDLEDGYALFENGWQIQYPPVIDRFCEGEDIISFSDFLRRFGPGSTTVIDVETQQVLRVRCAGQDRIDDPTPTTLAPTDLPTPTVDAPIPGEEIDENDGVVEAPTTPAGDDDGDDGDGDGSVTGNIDDG